jgi:hypothetical protein
LNDVGLKTAGCKDNDADECMLQGLAASTQKTLLYLAFLVVLTSIAIGSMLSIYAYGRDQTMKSIIHSF